MIRRKRRKPNYREIERMERELGMWLGPKGASCTNSTTEATFDPTLFLNPGGKAYNLSPPMGEF